MSGYQSKKIPFPDRISAEVKLLISLPRAPSLPNYGNPFVEKMFHCLVGNIDSTRELKAPKAPNNLIREVRRFHWTSIDNSLNKLVLECKSIIFHSLTLIGFVTIEMNDLFLRSLFADGLDGDIGFNGCYFTLNSFLGLNSSRLKYVPKDHEDKDLKDCIGELWLDGLDVEIGRFFQYTCFVINTCGVATSSSLFLENGYCMFAVTPRQFDALEKRYNNHVTKLHRSYRKLQTEIVKLLKEYASRQEDLKMPKEKKCEGGGPAGPGLQARILSGLVEKCDSLVNLRILIEEAVASYPLNCKSFKPIGQNINILIKETRKASPDYFFRQKEFKLPKDIIDSSFTSSSSGSSCSSSSSSLNSRAYLEGQA